MKNILHSWLSKFVLMLCCVSLIYALVASGMCDGPIESIFPGWRDSTVCFGYTQCTVFIPAIITPDPMSPYTPSLGAVVGVLSTFVFSLIYLLIALPKMFRKNFEKENESKSY